MRVLPEIPVPKRPLFVEVEDAAGEPEIDGFGVDPGPVGGIEPGGVGAVGPAGGILGDGDSGPMPDEATGSGPIGGPAGLL